MSGGNKGVHAFPKGISPKVNGITPLGLELPYFVAAEVLINHYTTGAEEIFGLNSESYFS